MILYRRWFWGSELLLWGGSIYEALWLPTLLYMAYCWLVFILAGLLRRRDEAFLIDDHNSLKILGGFASFSLVFTLNQCYARYRLGIDGTAELFSTLQSLQSVACAYGGTVREFSFQEAEDPAAALREAVAFKVHVTRLTLALALAFAFHMRLVESTVMRRPIEGDGVLAAAFDLTRLRGLLLGSELRLLEANVGLMARYSPQCRGPDHFEGLQVSFRQKEGRAASFIRPLFPAAFGSGRDISQMTGAAMPVIVVQLLRGQLAAAMCKLYPERSMNVFEQLLKDCSASLSHLEQLVSLPLPVPYLQQRKLLFMTFLLIWPLTLRCDTGWWANTVTPALIFVAMAGLDHISGCMENPLGDDTMDLNMGEMIHDLEVKLGKVFLHCVREALLQQDVFTAPFRSMPLPEEGATSAAGDGLSQAAGLPLRGLLDQWGFDTHFRWKAIPPQIFVQSVQKVSGQCEAQRAAAALQAAHAASTVSGSSSGSSDSDKGEQRVHVGCVYSRCGGGAPRPCPAETTDMPHVDCFLCLRAREHEVDTMLAEFDRAFAAGTDDAGCSGQMLEASLLQALTRCSSSA